MSTKSPLQKLQEKINKQCLPYLKKLETEKDEIKILKLQFQVSKKALDTTLTELKKLSDSQWEKYTEEIFEPIIKQSEQVSEKIDTLILQKSTSVKEYEKYQKLKQISKKGNEDLFQALENTDLSKKQLVRLLVLVFRTMIATDISLIQNNLDFSEFNEASGVVQRRFGFDYNWLVCLSLIQLHENLIKKKIVDLNGEIKEDEPIRSLISRLSELIREKEKREVSFALLLSNGIKTARDTMSHEGFKHSVSKKDLGNVWNEIVELEKILYSSQ